MELGNLANNPYYKAITLYNVHCNDQRDHYIQHGCSHIKCIINSA